MSVHDKVLDLHEERIQVLRRLENDDDFLEKINLEIDRLTEGMEGREAQVMDLKLDIDLKKHEIAWKQRELVDLIDQLHKFES